MQPLRARFENGFGDMRHADRTFQHAKGAARIDYAFGAVLALAGVLALVDGSVDWWAIALLVLAPLVALDIVSPRPLKLWLVYRRNELLRGTYDVEADDDALHIRSGDVESRIEWRRFDRFLETQRAFVLGYDRDLYTYVPKRAFATADDVERFRALARR